MTTIYGIKNCDTVKKALAWLKENKIEFTFHDFKTDWISAGKLKTWLRSPEGGNIINKKSTTWRGLSDTEKAGIVTEKGTIKLMQQYSSIIKRPVLEINGTILSGFSSSAYQNAFTTK